MPGWASCSLYSTPAVVPSHTCPASIVVPVVASRRAPVAETPRLFEGGHHIPLLRCKVPVTGASIPTAGTDTHTLSSDRGTSVGAGPTGEGFGFDDVTASGTCNRPASVSSKPGGVQCAPHHMHAAPTSITAKLSTRTSREPCTGSPFSLAMGGAIPGISPPTLLVCQLSVTATTSGDTCTHTASHGDRGPHSDERRVQSVWHVTSVNLATWGTSRSWSRRGRSWRC